MADRALCPDCERESPYENHGWICTHGPGCVEVPLVDQREDLIARCNLRSEELRAANAEIDRLRGCLTAERNGARDIVKSYRTDLLHEYQRAHKPHCVRLKLGGSIIEWAAAELAAMRAKLEEPK